MRVALFGGSFNPIHNNHLRIIDEVLNKRLADEVWIVPCKNHAFDKKLINGFQRIEMIKLALKKRENVKINKIEFDSKNKNYTIETLRKLKKEYPYEFCLIIGADVLYEVNTWYKYDELIKENNFLVFQREGYPIQRNPKGKMRIMKNSPKSTSSTEIRNRVYSNKSLKKFLPKEVEYFIMKNNLYKNGI